MGWVRGEGGERERREGGEREEGEGGEREVHTHVKQGGLAGGPGGATGSAAGREGVTHVVMCRKRSGRTRHLVATTRTRLLLRHTPLLPFPCPWPVCRLSGSGGSCRVTPAAAAVRPGETCRRCCSCRTAGWCCLVAGASRARRCRTLGHMMSTGRIEDIQRGVGSKRERGWGRVQRQYGRRQGLQQGQLCLKGLAASCYAL